MSSVNKVILVGRLGQAPEVKFTQSGTAVANFSVATSEKWKDKDTGELVEKTTWIRIVAFNRQAELAGEYLDKGRQVYIEGKLQVRQWETDSGEKRYITEVVARQIVFLGSGGGKSKEDYQAEALGGQYIPPGMSAPEDGDIPF